MRYLPVRVGVLFLEPGLVRVGMRMHDAVVVVFMLVHGMRVGVLDVGMLVRGVLVVVLMDV